MAFKSWAPLDKCRDKTNNTQMDDAQCIGVVKCMYNFIEYIDNYSEASGSLCQYYAILKIFLLIIIVLHSKLRKYINRNS